MSRKLSIMLLLAMLMSLVLTACDSTPAAVPENTPAAAGNTPAAAGDPTATVVVPPSKGDKSAISAWAQANNVETYRAKNIETAAEGLGLKAEAIADPTGWGDYKKKFLLA